VQHVEGKALAAAHIEHDVSFLFGGQIKDGRLQLFMIYSAGNFIECTIDTPYLQIGEHKYGKPVLDRAVGYDTDLYDALKIGLISMDSTMRSNLGVGLPSSCARMSATPRSTTGSNRASPISKICGPAGRRPCAPPTFQSRVHPIGAPAEAEEAQILQGDMLCGVALHLPSVNRTRRIACSHR
jgi:hypothetical protein